MATKEQSTLYMDGEQYLDYLSNKKYGRVTLKDKLVGIPESIEQSVPNMAIGLGVASKTIRKYLGANLLKQLVPEEERADYKPLQRLEKMEKPLEEIEKKAIKFGLEYEIMLHFFQLFSHQRLTNYT